MKKNYLNKILQILVIVGIALIASISLSCSSDDITDSIPLISGVAVDGYIKGARVYFDCDKDFTYDSDEVLTYTDDNGKFSFVSNAANVQNIKDCPVVVDATDTEYVFDSDHKETDSWPSLKDVGREGFKISSPVGEYKVISPLTMIVHTIDPNDDAKIQNQLGITANDLNTMGLQNIRELLHLDYFSTNDITDPDQIKVLEKIAKAGRLLARVLEVKQSPTNSDANTCIGQKCPELMKEALAHFDDIYHENGVFDEKGVPIPDYHNLYEDIENRESAGGGETFKTRFDGDKIDLDEFANAAIFQQKTEKPCTAEGSPNTDFEFMISFTRTFSNDIKAVASHFPNAETIYQSYQESLSSTDSSLDCVNFFKNRGDNKTSKLAKAIAFTRFISTDSYAHMSNVRSSTFYQGFYYKGGTTNDVTLTKYYMKECSNPDDFLCYIPYNGKDWTIAEAIDNGSQKIKTIKFDIDTMDITVETSTKNTSDGMKTQDSLKHFIILDNEILKQVADTLSSVLGSGEHQ